MLRTLPIIILVLAFSFFFSCSSGSEYYQMVERELASGERYDSLFLGIHFGMSDKDFFTHCWELNKKGLIMEGPNNTTVKYDISDLKYPASMNFYPGFFEDKIVELPVIFTYSSWAPWNEHLHAKYLKKDVLQLMEKWYGHGFIEIKNPKGNKPGVTLGDAFVKVDGNRRISIYDIDDSNVRVDFVDLSVQEQMKKTKAQSGN